MVDIYIHPITFKDLICNINSRAQLITIANNIENATREYTTSRYNKFTWSVRLWSFFIGLSVYFTLGLLTLYIILITTTSGKQTITFLVWVSVVCEIISLFFSTMLTVVIICYPFHKRDILAVNLDTTNSAILKFELSR